MATPIIGIDLGTTYSAVATVNLAGKPEIIANEQGEKFTASAILFESSDELLVGQIAINSNQPQDLERWFKKKMGDAAWKSKEHFGRTYSAVDLSAMVLKKLKRDAGVTIGEITKVVVTVPAYFGDMQRKSTMDAASKAGLEVLSLINEPTAAALAFAQTGNVEGRCLVYDFGGGTFDVSIVDIKSPEIINVISSEGDNNLGGHNLDEDLSELIDREFIRNNGFSMLDSKASPVDRHEIINCAERIKRDLSRRETISSIPIHGEKGRLKYTAERTVFEKTIRSRIKQTELLVDLVLKNNGLKPDDIDHVLLVGGSTRVPAVQEMLAKKFGKEPDRSVNPDEAVALGAALKAAYLLMETDEVDLPIGTKERLERVSVADVVNRAMGTFAYIFDEGGFEDHLGNSIIIPKDSSLPAEYTRSYYTREDNQTAVDVVVTEGDEEDIRFVTRLGEYTMPLPAGRPQGQEIKITYKYDLNQRMDATVEDVSSGKIERFSIGVGQNSPDVPTIDDDIFDELEIE